MYIKEPNPAQKNVMGNPGKPYSALVKMGQPYLVACVKKT